MWVGEAGHISVRDDDAGQLWPRPSSGCACRRWGWRCCRQPICICPTFCCAAQARCPWDGAAPLSSAYVVGGLWLALTWWTGLVIAGPVLTVWGTHYRAGSLYPLFVVYAIGLTLWSLLNIFRTRARCLTASLRRRMAYLGLSFVVPALGMIPYLLATYALDVLPDPLLAILPVCGSIGVTVMIVTLAYIVSYQGVFLPDRVVKQSLINYLLRGPFLGVAITFIIITVPRLGRVFAVFTDRFQVFAVVFVIVVLQALLDRLRPVIDRIIQQDEEIVWLEELNQRLLTSADLSELLDNTLIAVCEVLARAFGLHRRPRSPHGRV